MIDPESQIDTAINHLIQVRDMPEANTPEGHITRSATRDEILHIVSEMIVLDIIPHVREEGDVFRRFRSETA